MREGGRGAHQGREDEDLERGEVRELQLARRLVRQRRRQLPLRVQLDLPPHHLQREGWSASVGMLDACAASP